MDTAIEETKKRSYNLKNLYLDPNNYRFVDNDDYKEIEDDELIDERIQQRTRGFIEGIKRSNIKDLLASFKTNGFLDVDVIQVRDLGENKYLVLEGNRRVTTLKVLQEDYEAGKDIGNLNPDIFKKVPFEIHRNETKEKHLIIMGLKHISGNKKWSALNQAQLIYDYLSQYWNTDDYYDKETQLCDSLGITKAKLRSSQRAYHLILAYKKGDFGDQFESEFYSLFVEIIKRPSLKDWIEWDDSLYKARHENNLQRLFSWMSKVEEFDENYSANDEGLDDFEEFKEREAIITKALEIRDLALFINNENALMEMEKTQSVSRGLLASGIIDQQMYETSINDLKNSIHNLTQYKGLFQNDDTELLNNIKKQFLHLLPKKSSLDIAQGNVSICFEHGEIHHFDSILINQYKLFNGFHLQKLNRINIFAGFNNSGKSSLLEAIYYLTKQNDITSFLEITKLRNKLNSLDTVWLNSVISKEDIIDIEGVFNKINTSIQFFKFEATDIDKRDDYVASYNLKAKVDDRELDNIIHTFRYSPLQRKNEKVEHLCSSLLKSPYFYNQKEIVEAYSKNTIYKTEDGTTAIKLIIEFLKEIDPTIVDIRLNEIEEIERFVVDSSKYKEKNLEITNYGEGLQRIFEIALSFAKCKNGVVCIDEFETAIHYTLLVKFTKFIQQLSKKFNVQVFLTSHSKECIDAFVNNDYNNNEISAYFLENVSSKVQTKFVEGERLKYLVDNLSLDIRGNTNE